MAHKFALSGAPYCMYSNKLGARSKPIGNKWKNHFYEMKGDVGMSHHEKERNKKMHTQRQKVIQYLIPNMLTVPALTRSYLPIPNIFVMLQNACYD